LLLIVDKQKGIDKKNQTGFFMVTAACLLLDRWLAGCRLALLAGWHDRAVAATASTARWLANLLLAEWSND